MSLRSRWFAARCATATPPATAPAPSGVRTLRQQFACHCQAQFSGACSQRWLTTLST